MKIKLDENLPASLVPVLVEFGHNVDTIPNEGLAGAVDSDVWNAAQGEGRFFITQDLDFSNISQFSPGSHHGILLIRLHNPSRRALLERLQSLFASENVTSWRRHFVVVTDRKIRVRAP